MLSFEGWGTRLSRLLSSSNRGDLLWSVKADSEYLM